MSTTTRNPLRKLVLATHMLVSEGILDAFGHVSVRCPGGNGRYCMLTHNHPTNNRRFVVLNSSNAPVSAHGSKPSLERFIHGEIYRARQDVGAIVHTHAPALIPFGVSTTRLKPLYHMCGFLVQGVPVFDMDDYGFGPDVLVRSCASGMALARCLGNSAVVLMRGHGAAIVGATMEEVVFRAIYTVINAQLQTAAMSLGDSKYLSQAEGELSDAMHKSIMDRSWSFIAAKLNLSANGMEKHENKQ